MSNLILFLLASVGFSHILVESTICDPLRTWFRDRAPKPIEEGYSGHSYSGYNPPPTLFSWLCGKISYILGCYQCSGAWAGWIMATFILSSWNLDASLVYNLFANLVIIVPAGFAASIASNTTAIFLTYLEANAMIK